MEFRPPCSRRLPACLAAAAILLAAAGACSDATEPEQSVWQGELQPLPPATVGGSVAVASRFGRSETSILIKDALPGTTYNWRIRAGSCTAAGDVVGGGAVYPALSPGGSGEAGAETTLSRQLDPQETYAAWVFDGTDGDPGEPAACGQLLRLN